VALVTKYQIAYIIGEPDLELVDAVNTYDLNEAGKGFHGKLSALLEWHKSDPVDSFEIHRNNVVYSYQNNRNPFIDYPEYVDLIWISTNTKEVTQPSVKIYPNPVSDTLYIELSGNEPSVGKIYSMHGKLIREFSMTGKSQISVQELNSGVYILEINSNNQVSRQKLIISK